MPATPTPPTTAQVTTTSPTALRSAGLAFSQALARDIETLTYQLNQVSKRVASAVQDAASLVFGSGWLNWTPTVAPTGSMTVSGVTISAATYLQIGPLCYIDASLGFTTGGTLSNACYVVLPMAYKGTATQYVPISTWGTTGVPSNVCAIGVLNPGSTLFTVFAGTDTITNYSAGAHSLYLNLSYRCQ